MRQYKEYELEDMFNDFLNECYGTVKIAGYEYDTASVLKEIDEIAYREGFNNWLDSEKEEENLFEHSDGEIYDEQEEE